MNMPEPEDSPVTAASVAAETARLEAIDLERRKALRKYVSLWRRNPVIEFTGTKAEWCEWGFGYIPHRKSGGVTLVNTDTQRPTRPFMYGTNEGKYAHGGVNWFPTWLRWYHPEMLRVLGRSAHFTGYPDLDWPELD